MFNSQFSSGGRTAMSGRIREYDLENRLIEFAATIIDIVEQMPSTRAANHVAGQLVRSGTSPASNYGEAESAESRRDFIHKMRIAFKELRETRVWLRIVLRKAFLDDAESVKVSLAECEELIRVFGKSISTAESGRMSIVGNETTDGRESSMASLSIEH
jgi:four helix bundle protein